MYSLGLFSLLPYEIIIFLVKKMDPPSFYNLRLTHPLLNKLFSNDFNLSHLLNHGNGIQKSVTFQYFCKHFSTWGIREMIRLQFNDAHSIFTGMKCLITRGPKQRSASNVQWILENSSSSDLNVSDDFNFIMRWAFKRNLTALCAYIARRGDFDITQGKYDLLKVIGKKYSTEKKQSLYHILPVPHEHIIKKLVHYACKHDNAVLLARFEKEFYEFDLEEDVMNDIINYESFYCLEVVIKMIPSLWMRPLPYDWFDKCIEHESIQMFRKISYLHNNNNRNVQHFDQNNYITTMAIRGKLNFLEEFATQAYRLDKIQDHIAVYAMTIYYNWKKQFLFLMDHYPLPFDNHNVQWLLFYCVNTNRNIFYFQKLVERGCRPVSIPLEKVKTIELNTLYTFPKNEHHHLIAQRKDFSNEMDGYYVFCTDSLFIRAIQTFVDFSTLMTQASDREKEEYEKYILPQMEGKEEWVQFINWLDRDTEEKFMNNNPYPQISREIMFSISKNFDFDGRNPWRKFIVV